MPPLVAIVLPVHNAARFLAPCLQSLRAQSHRQLYTIVIDDGSCDHSSNILATRIWSTFAAIYRQPNRGAVAALNRGLDLALQTPAEFIAIMHADDIALPQRIEKQVAYFAANPHIAVAGTWIQTFSTPAPRTWQHHADPRFTKPTLLFRCCFAHPTIMFRRSVIESGLRYDPAFPAPCEDYALWARASETHAMGNLPEVLLHYRVHPGQATHLHQKKLFALTHRIRAGLLARLGLTPTSADMALHQRLSESRLDSAAAFVDAVRLWLERIAHANTSSQRYDQAPLQKILAGRWAAVCLHAAAHATPGIWPRFWQSPLAQDVDRTLTKNQLIPNP